MDKRGEMMKNMDGDAWRGLAYVIQCLGHLRVLPAKRSHPDSERLPQLVRCFFTKVALSPGLEFACKVI